MTKPESYPFLRIAKQYGVEYADVLAVAQEFQCATTSARGILTASDNLNRWLSLPDRDPFWRDFLNARAEFLAIQRGDIDWLTGEPIKKDRPLTMDGFAAHIQRTGRALRKPPEHIEITDYAPELPRRPRCPSCGQDHSLTYPNGARMFADDCTMLDEKGNRSIFDDIDD